MCVIKVQIIRPIYNHCDDLIKVFICKQHCCKVVNTQARITFLVTSVHEESSMDVLTLNMLLSSSKFIIKSNKCECPGLGFML